MLLKRYLGILASLTLREQKLKVKLEKMPVLADIYEVLFPIVQAKRYCFNHFIHSW
jgi:hypothetical protein